MSSQHPSQKVTRTYIAAAITLALGLSPITVLHADTAATQAQNQTLNYAIPSGDLDSVLNQFALASNMDLSFPSQLTAGKTSPGLKGSYNIDSALNIILQGTNLTYTITDSHVINLMKRAAPKIQESKAKPVDKPKITPPEMLSPLIVTGEKIERTVQETASSVAIISDDEIEQSGLYDTLDIYDRIANVSNERGGEGLNIRGISNNGVAGTATGYSTLNIDGAYISNRGFNLGQKSLWDIKQVEVFRGPQSTNQGRSALAGAVFIRSNDPTYEPEGRYRIGYGSDNTRIFSLAYSDALIKDQLAFRVSMDDQSSDGFIDNVILDDDEYGDNSNRLLRAKLLFEPEAIEGLSVLATLSHSKNKSGDAFSSSSDGTNEIDPFDRDNFANVKGYEHFDQKIASLDINYDLNDYFSLTSITAYSGGDYDRQDDADRTPAGGTAQRTRQGDFKHLTQELRLNFDSDNMRGHLGFYYFDGEEKIDIDDVLARNVRQDIIDLQGPAAQPLADLYDDPFIFNRTGDGENNNKNWAIFSNLEYDFNHFLTVYGGLRYDREKVENSQVESRSLGSSLPNPALVPAPLAPGVTFVNGLLTNATNFAALDNDNTFSAWLPKAGLTLHWTDDLSTSFTMQRAYQAGGAGSTTTGNYTFDPEYSINYDFALRSQWLDRRLTVNANLFYVDWDDMQVTVINPNNPLDFRVVNASKAKLKGAELEITADPSHNLSMYTSIGYVKTEFTNFPDSVNAFGSTFTTETNLNGNEFPHAPRLTIAAGVLYNVTNKLSVQLDGNYRESSYNNNTNTVRNDSRTLFNSKIKYDINDKVAVSLIGRNIFDKDYIVVGETITDVVNVGDSRTVLLQLEGQF